VNRLKSSVRSFAQGRTLASIIAATVASAALAVPALHPREAYAAGKTQFVIVFPGGPDAKGQGEKLLGDFIREVTKAANLPAEDFTGVYFNELDPAVKALAANNDSFILGSLGFYLTHRAAHKLVPLAEIKHAGGAHERFYVLTKKGKFTAMSQLKGKTLSGNVLYEDPRFISAIVFDGQFDAKADFKLQPTPQPLRAIRKLATDEIDAVLINQMQYESLTTHPAFADVEVLYKSAELPALSLMAVDTKATGKVKDKLVETLSKICDAGEGATMCRGFGLVGFKPVNVDALKPLQQKFDAAR
jgi:hypothetical protein